MEELSASARTIAENSEAQAGLAEATLKNAEESVDAMQEATEVMNRIMEQTRLSSEKIMELGARSQQIGKVLALINRIAAETKMLSFNAAIEASKAGEAGKGFAVVAGEIRKLAEEVVKSTAGIEEILGEIREGADRSVMAAEENVKAVSAGARRVESVHQVLQEICSMAEQSNDAARQVSVATSPAESRQRTDSADHAGTVRGDPADRRVGGADHQRRGRSAHPGHEPPGTERLFQVGFSQRPLSRYRGKPCMTAPQRMP